MNIQERIAKPLSKIEVQHIVEELYGNKSCLAEFILLFHHAAHSDMNRAAWILGVFAERHMSSLTTHLPTIANCLNIEPITDGVKRNVLRILRQIPLPENIHSMVMNKCFDYVANPNEAIAVRSFALETLTNLAAFYPDIKPEIQCIAEDILQHQQPSAGLKSRAMKTLKMLR